MANGIPTVLVPGLLCDAALWKPQVKWLADVARISIGDTMQDDNLGDMARRILAAAPERFALAGLSMGGYVCMEIMRQAPERVIRLALLDTGARADSEEQTKRRRGLLELAELGKFKGVTPRLLPLLIHPGRKNDAALNTTVMEMSARVGQEAFFRQQQAIMHRPDSRSDLETYDLPVMVLCGREDALTPVSLHEEMASLISGARLCIVEECGHLSPIERPHAVTALMRDWLIRD